jgi:hypothetical protein
VPFEQPQPAAQALSRTAQRALPKVEGSVLHRKPILR